jgi:hypothetical protein
LLEILAKIIAIVTAFIAIVTTIWKRRDKVWPPLRNWYFRTWGLASAKPNLSGLNRNKLAEVLAEHYENFGSRILEIDKMRIPLIVSDAWIPEKPLDFSKITLEWEGGPSAFPSKWEGLVERLTRECEVVIEDNPTYRLLSMKNGEGLCLKFGLGSYKDYVETCEALAWELAWHVRPSIVRRLIGHKNTETREKCKETLKKPTLKKRSKIEALDFSNRSTAVGINVLTVITNPNEGQRDATFLIHHRGKVVAEGIEAFHVIPAGTFQPFHKRDAYHDVEFNIAWTILREFGEEVLNKETIIKTKWSYLDPKAPFEEDEELKKLYLLFQKECVNLYFLGIGLDCLTLKPEIMILLLINGRTMANVIPRVKRGLEGNWEGRIIENRAFEKKELRALVANAKMTPSGKGCCALAVRNFDWIQERIDELIATNLP